MSSGIFIMLAIIGMGIAIWGAIKLPKNADGFNKELRDAYLGSRIRRYIKDKFLK